jgi:hypothetical protein
MRMTAFAMFLALAACAPQAPEPTPAAPEAPVDAWVGDWPGVEGTFLRIEAGVTPGAYTLTQGTLDGVATYPGAVDGDAIVFTRAGGAAPERIRRGSGAETGLKWLLEKSDCLVIREGEGYCRD